MQFTGHYLENEFKITQMSNSEMNTEEEKDGEIKKKYIDSKKLCRFDTILCSLIFTLVRLIHLKKININSMTLFSYLHTISIIRFSISVVIIIKVFRYRYLTFITDIKQLTAGTAQSKI